MHAEDLGVACILQVYLDLGILAFIFVFDLRSDTAFCTSSEASGSPL